MCFTRNRFCACDEEAVKGRRHLGIVIPDCGFHLHYYTHIPVTSCSSIVELAIHSKMEELMTPKQSSVLVTPSSTKSVFYSPRILSPLLLLLPAMPKSSLEHSPSLPACKDILSELFLGGLPLVAERIFSLLKPADLCSSLRVCTTWNRQISSGSQFMNSINTYRRQWKENAENLYVIEEPMETTVTPTKRRPFAAFTPNTQSRLQTAKPTYTVDMCIKPWHEGECSGRMTPSKRPRQSEGICSAKSKKRLRRL